MFCDTPSWDAPFSISSDDEAVHGSDPGSMDEAMDGERQVDQAHGSDPGSKDGERQVDQDDEAMDGERQDGECKGGECQKRNRDDDDVVIDAPSAKVRMPHFARVGPDFTRRGMVKLQLEILQRQKRRWEEMTEEERQAVRKKKRKKACSLRAG